MRNRVLITALLVVAVSVTPLMVFAASVPSVGSLAPEFTLDLAGGYAGQPHGLSRQMGGLVLLSQRFQQRVHDRGA